MLNAQPTFFSNNFDVLSIVCGMSCCRAWQLALCSCALRLLLRKESSEMGSI